MTTVLRLAAPFPHPTNPEGQVPEVGWFVKAYDPDAHDGRGEVWWTPDPLDAMLFENGALAFDCYRQTSTVRPWRPDGRPNRPLTACTISVEPATSDPATH
jgi:hypothetical protein